MPDVFVKICMLSFAFNMIGFVILIFVFLPDENSFTIAVKRIGLILCYSLKYNYAPNAYTYKNIGFILKNVSREAGHDS